MVKQNRQRNKRIKTMNILAFAATNSSQSINKQLVSYAVDLLDEAESEIIDLNDYELPLFSEDREKELGQPALAQQFLDKINNSDAVVISFAEHNGSYTVAYKNIFDWASRINPKVFQGKPMILLATSPGPGGASSVLAAAVNSAPYFDGDVKASLSVPSFYENFDADKTVISNDDLAAEILSTMQQLLKPLVEAA